MRVYDGGGQTPVVTPGVGAPGNVWEPSISPDEKAIVFRRSTSSTSDIWRRDLARGTETRFTFDASGNLDPSWSPKGDRIVFNSNRGGSFNLYQTSGSGRDELLLSTPYNKVPDQWSRDDRFIVYSEADPKTKWDLWVLPLGQRRPVPFLQSGFNELYGQLSPDSGWMAYTSDESGQREVYVRPFPRLRRQVADFNRGRRATALAGRRQRAVLCGSGRKDDGGSGESGCRAETLL